MVFIELLFLTSKIWPDWKTKSSLNVWSMCYRATVEYFFIPETFLSQLSEVNAQLSKTELVWKRSDHEVSV